MVFGHVLTEFGHKNLGYFIQSAGFLRSVQLTTILFVSNKIDACRGDSGGKIAFAITKRLHTAFSVCCQKALL